jgi:hypothetical protein
MNLTKAKDIWNTPGLNVDPVAYLASHPAELLEKMRSQITAAVSLLLAGGTVKASADAVLVGLFVLAVLVPRRESRQQAVIRWLVCVCLITALLVGAAAFLRWRHLYLFLPVGLVYVAEAVDRVLAAGTDQASPALRRLRGAALAILACAAWLLPAFTYPEHVASYEETVRTTRRMMPSYWSTCALQSLCTAWPGTAGDSSSPTRT